MADGKTICWSKKSYNKEFAPFQMPCGKCAACRLENARQTAVRCVHESKMHPENSFITLTYSEENLASQKLQYNDVQKFIKDLRSQRFEGLQASLFPTINDRKTRRKLWNQLPKERRDELFKPIQISTLIAGEYGDKNKRPHWHLIIFNWRPSDCEYKYTSDRGDEVHSSRILDQLWNKGNTEVGTVTFESASYVARYALKKLSHGKDGEHDYHPISKRSCKNAIGKTWLERFWPDVFNHGHIVLPNGKKCGIPRYYEKWFKKHHPEKWENYLRKVKSKIIEEAVKKQNEITQEERKENFKRSALHGLQMIPVRTRKQSEEIILNSRLKKLQELQKL